MHTNRKLEKVSLAMQTSNELIIKIFIYYLILSAGYENM